MSDHSLHYSYVHGIHKNHKKEVLRDELRETKKETSMEELKTMFSQYMQN